MNELEWFQNSYKSSTCQGPVRLHESIRIGIGVNTGFASRVVRKILDSSVDHGDKSLLLFN